MSSTHPKRKPTWPRRLLMLGGLLFLIGALLTAIGLMFFSPLAYLKDPITLERLERAQELSYIQGVFSLIGLGFYIVTLVLEGIVIAWSIRHKTPPW